MTHLTPPKPYKSYADLVTLLISRGMQVADALRAQRKLAQVGYYRLSGYWYVCRELCRGADGLVRHSHLTGLPLRQEAFQSGTNFDDVFKLYLFDKRLRLLMLDGIERIEIHVRSVIAHEVGYHDPMGYQNPAFIHPRQTRNFIDKRTNKQRNAWNEWLARQNDQVNRSREDCIEWHRHTKKAMPFWVVVEAWDFGTVSKYFELLKGEHQNRVARRLGVDKPNVLKVWLQELNTLRNRCAHHGRIWNQNTSNPLPVLEGDYFKALNLDHTASTRLCGLLAIVWFLIHTIGPSSEWIHDAQRLVTAKPDLPGCTYAAMGFDDVNNFFQNIIKHA